MRNEAFFVYIEEKGDSRGLLNMFSFLLAKKLQKVYITLVPVVVGIVLASNSEPLFHLWGFLACFTATFARALKSVLQGLLLTNENERLDSLNLLLFMSPSALGKSI